MMTSVKFGRGAVVAAAAMVFSAGTALASTTGSVDLEGSVVAVTEVTVEAAGGASSLDLTVDNSSSPVTVATVTERSNNIAGYIISMESANLAAGTCANSTPCLSGADGDNTFLVDYDIVYDSATITTYVSGEAEVTDTSGEANLTDRITTSAGTDKTVGITYNASATLLPADTYSDTLTFTISTP